MSSWALVPVKAGSTGKQRLGQELTPDLRTRLIRVMLTEVLAALTGSPRIDGLAVLSAGREGVPAGTLVLEDAGLGLNAALQAALPQLQARGATRVTILFADLPLVRAEDVTQLVAACDGAGVALAPDHTGTGTNGLTLALPSAFQLQFGPGSFARHLKEAERAGSRAAAVRRAGLAFDIDEPDDLAALRARHDPRYAFLA